MAADGTGVVVASWWLCVCVVAVARGANLGSSTTTANDIYIYIKTTTSKVSSKHEGILCVAFLFLCHISLTLNCKAPMEDVQMSSPLGLRG